MGHEPVLVPDQTMFIQLALFMASYFVLRTLVFKPYLNLLQERREKTLGMKEKAQSNQDAAEKSKLQYEEFLKAERKKLAEWSEQERRGISEEEKAIIDKARLEATKQQQLVSAALTAEVDKARKESKTHVSEYASQLASKLLDRKVQLNGGSARSKSEVVESVPG